MLLPELEEARDLPGLVDAVSFSPMFARSPR